MRVGKKLTCCVETYVLVLDPRILLKENQLGQNGSRRRNVVCEVPAVLLQSSIRGKCSRTIL